jgi:hypothetical protein
VTLAASDAKYTMNWKDSFETIYYVAASIAALGALFVYLRNSKFERAKWASQLYESFYQKDNLKDIRDKLDCAADSDEVKQLVAQEDFQFTDYLNFFEFIAFLKATKQLGDSEVEDLFGYYLNCLNRHTDVRKYILDLKNGYEGLAKLIVERK